MQLVVLQARCFFQITVALRLSDGMAKLFVLTQQLAEFVQLIPLLLPTTTQVVEAGRTIETVALQLNSLSLWGLFCRQHRQFNPAKIGFCLLHHLWLGSDFHLELGSRFIDQINGLIGQTAITDVSIRQSVRGLQRLIRDRHAVMQLITLFQATQNLQAQGQIRLSNQHLLKTTIQGWVFLHGAAVILGRRGTDATEITPGEGRLQQAAGIGAAALTPHHRVQFVDKQHHPRIRATHLLQNRAKPFLELTPKFGAGDEGSEVEGYQSHPLERFRHFTRHNPLRQQFGDGRLSHSGCPNQHRIVFAATR